MFKMTCTILMVVVLLLMGCASKPSDPKEELVSNMEVMRSAVRDVIKDAERQKRLLTLTISLEKILLDYNQSYSDFVAEFGRLNREYTTPRKTLEALQASFRAVRESAMNEVLDIHFQMVAQTSGDEWEKIVKKEIEALRSARQFPGDKLGEQS